MEFVKTPKYRVNSWQQKKLNMGCTLDEVIELEAWFNKLREQKKTLIKSFRGNDESRAIAKERARQWRDEQKNKQNVKPIDV